MNISVEAQIKCPFYIKEKAELICCEGFLDNTCMTTRFPSRKAKTAHVRKHCFLENGGKCPMAVNLYEKYKASEEKEERQKAELRAGKKAV